MECQESVPSNEINVSTFYYGQRQDGPSQQDEQASRTKEDHSPSDSSLSCSKTSQAEALKRILYHNDKGNAGQPIGYRLKHQKKNSCQLMKKSNIIDYSVNRQYQLQFAGTFDKNEGFAAERQARKESRVVTSSSANIYSSEKKHQLGAANFGRSQSRAYDRCSPGGSGNEN